MENDRLAQQLSEVQGTLLRIEQLLNQTVVRLGYIELHCSDTARRILLVQRAAPREGGTT